MNTRTLTSDAFMKTFRDICGEFADFCNIDLLSIHILIARISLPNVKMPNTLR